MAGRGVPPKPADQRRRRNAVPETVAVAEDGLERGPELPAGDWPMVTLAWWATWRRSPQAQTFTATDWDFLLDTALLHAELWRGERSVAAELRLRVAKFGATPEDRMRLRLAVKVPDAEVAPPPVRRASSQRRARILKAVDGATG
jgi:hypothetical protein